MANSYRTGRRLVGAIALLPLAGALIAASALRDDVVDPPSSAYLALLPDGETKRGFIRDCTGCHVFDARVAFPAGEPRSAESWEERIRSMHARFGRGTGFPIIADPADPTALAAWLATALRRAPASRAAAPASVQVREYVLPVAGDLPHDLMRLPDGRMLITGMFTAQMYVLDPRDGSVETTAIPVPNANPRALHVDADGGWWVLLGAPGMLAYRAPDGTWTTHDVGMYAHSIARDRRGVWVNGHFTGHPSRLVHVDAVSGAIRNVEVPSETRPGVSPIPYELRTAPDGRIWMSELHGNRVVVVDPNLGVSQAFTMPVSHSGPRRLDIAADGTVWIPLYTAGEVVALDPATGEMRRYPLPDRDALPYVVRVDDARQVLWVGTGASDAVYRLDLRDGRFTTIPLPSRGALVRHLDVDASTGDVWAAYGASPGTLSARVARIQP
jgi:virginiamycin B lyase